MKLAIELSMCITNKRAFKTEETANVKTLNRGQNKSQVGREFQLSLSGMTHEQGFRSFQSTMVCGSKSKTKQINKNKH